MRSVSADPWTNVVTASASVFCPARRNGFSAVCRSRSSISSWLQEGEHPQQVTDLGVIRVQPELVEGVGRHHLGVEPEGAGLGLAVLGAVGLGDERRGEGVRLAAVGTADQLGAAGDVAPLVGAAELQRHAVLAVEVQEVHRLQEHVAELGVADALLEPTADHVSGEHPVDREVLAHVAEEVDDRHVLGPVVVVDQRGGVRALEGDERRDLAAYALGPVLHGLDGVHHPLAGLLRVSDHAGGAADEDERRVARVLEPPGRGQLDQVAHVQARCGRVEPDIEPDAPLAQRRAERVAVGRVRDQAAPLEVVEDVRPGLGGHAASLPHGLRRLDAISADPGARAQAPTAPNGDSEPMSLDSRPSRVALLAESTPDSRNRVVDLLRAVAILVVVLGHWTVAAVYVDDAGELRRGDLLELATWTHPLTWVVQVMPVFFLVGGYANALSWRSARARGTAYGGWLRARLRRLTIPVLPLMVFWAVVAPVAHALGADGETLRIASRASLVPTWFLAAYVVVVSVAPLTLRLWERWGWASVVGLLALGGLVDYLSITNDVFLLGFLNYLVVWGAVHQLGYAWLDGSSPAPAAGSRWPPSAWSGSSRWSGSGLMACRWSASGDTA